ncbi:hypothetical protein OIU77_021108 [Salix suchowensis]|uniref:Uncharacterized protein n=1 Tax=Salix suchowensis TaxID=1278906 RepID=A0ABQ9CCU5_9ROSI|nr:hypothetical protein OIU77_021108 [Salix suchowensis]
MAKLAARLISKTLARAPENLRISQQLPRVLGTQLLYSESRLYGVLSIRGLAWANGEMQPCFSQYSWFLGTDVWLMVFLCVPHTRERNYTENELKCEKSTPNAQPDEVIICQHSETYSHKVSIIWAQPKVNRIMVLKLYARKSLSSHSAASLSGPVSNRK